MTARKVVDPFVDLDKRQRLALRQALGSDSFAAPTACVNRLVRLGLAVRTGAWYERVEWDRVVAREPVFYLTSAGEDAARAVLAKLAESAGVQS